MKNCTNMLNDIKFDISFPNNTWAFIGGKIANGTNISGYRTYISHFEEIIRWENNGNDTLKYGLQRFVINVSKDGDTVSNILAGYDNIIKPLGTKMVAIMPGIEDCQAGTDINKFKLDLSALIMKIREEGKILVLMTPNAVTNAKIKDSLANYIDAVREVAASEKVNMVDFYKLWKDQGDVYIDSRLSDDGILPNEMGHLDMGKQLANNVGSPLSSTGPMNTIVTRFNDVKTSYDSSNESKMNMWSIDNTGTVEKIKEKLTSGNPITWIILGDSITHGALWTYGYDDFTQLFEKRVRNEMGRNGDIVINTGVSGATTTEFINNKDSRFERYNSDIVFIMFGMNDCVLISVEEFRTNLERIIDNVRTKNAIPILMTPNVATGRGNHLPPYIESIRIVAQKKKVMLIDHFKEWTDISITTPVWEKWVNVADSESKIHPNSLGHLYMAQSIFKAIGIYDPLSELCTMNYLSIAIPNNRDIIIDNIGSII